MRQVGVLRQVIQECRVSPEPTSAQVVEEELFLRLSETSTTDFTDAPMPSAIAANFYGLSFFLLCRAVIRAKLLADICWSLREFLTEKLGEKTTTLRHSFFPSVCRH